MTHREAQEFYDRYIELKVNHGFKARAMGMYCEPIKMNKPMDPDVASELDFIAKSFTESNSLHLLSTKQLRLLANDERLGQRVSEMLGRLNV